MATIKKQNFVNAFFILLICSIYLVIEVESVYLSMKSKNKKTKGLKSFSSPLTSFLIQNETNFTNETMINDSDTNTDTDTDTNAKTDINAKTDTDINTTFPNDIIFNQNQNETQSNEVNNSTLTTNYTSNETVVINIVNSNNNSSENKNETSEEDNKYKYLDDSDIIGINQKLDLLGYNSKNSSLRNFINEEITNLEISSDGDVITSNCNKVFLNSNNTLANDSQISNYTTLQFTGNTSELDFKYKFISYMNDCIDNYDSFFTPKFVNDNSDSFNSKSDTILNDVSEIKTVLNDQIDAYFNLKKKVFEALYGIFFGKLQTTTNSTKEIIDNDSQGHFLAEKTSLSNNTNAENFDNSTVLNQAIEKENSTNNDNTTAVNENENITDKAINSTEANLINNSTELFSNNSTSSNSNTTISSDANTTLSQDSTLENSNSSTSKSDIDSQISSNSEIKPIKSTEISLENDGVTGITTY